MHLKRGSKSNLMNQYWGCIEFYAIKKKKEFYAIKKKKEYYACKEATAHAVL